jgi:hypothetical protein
MDHSVLEDYGEAVLYVIAAVLILGFLAVIMDAFTAF